MQTVHGKKFFYGILQGSILDLLIFNIFLYDLFYFLEGVAVASYADDTTPYSVNKTNDLVIKEIEHFSEVLFKWFDFNNMKINSGKSHMLFSGNAWCSLFFLILDSKTLQDSLGNF